MNHAVGSLVSTRPRVGRCPSRTTTFLVLRPLGGTDDEIAGILTELETIEPATSRRLDLTDSETSTPATPARCARLTFRSSAGPFRLRAHRCRATPVPTRAAAQGSSSILCASHRRRRRNREDRRGAPRGQGADRPGRGTAARRSVRTWPSSGRPRCATSSISRPSSSSRARRPALERGLRVGEPLFERYPITVVSMDYVKPSRHRETFLHTLPSLVIIDEATPAPDASARSRGRHQRYQLSRLAETPHATFLVTATPTRAREALHSDRLSIRHSASYRTTSRPTSARESVAGSLARWCSAAAATSNTLGDTPFLSREVSEGDVLAQLRVSSALREGARICARDRRRSRRRRNPPSACAGGPCSDFFRALASSPAAGLDAGTARAPQTR